eukprot:144201-Amphidinium_carterae.1
MSALPRCGWIACQLCTVKQWSIASEQRSQPSRHSSMPWASFRRLYRCCSESGASVSVTWGAMRPMA